MAVDTSMVSVYSYAGGNVTTGAYVQVIASTPTSIGRLQIVDTSTKILKIAIGPSGSEKDICTTAVFSGATIVPYFIPAGTRISIKAIDATATAGYNILSLIP